MNLRYLAIDVYEKGWDSDYPNCSSQLWCFNTRFISNYLSKNVRKFKIDVPDFNLILIILKKDPTKLYEFGKRYPSDLFLYIPFSQEDMDNLLSVRDFNARMEIYLSLFERGWKMLNNHFDIQLDKLLSLTQDFRANGYRNEWLFKKKIIPEYDIYVFFKCYFTSFDFRLRLEVYDKKKTTLITSGEVYKTVPGEYAYEKDFNKGIEIDGSKMYLLDFLSHRAFEFDLKKLAKGIFNVKYLDKYLFLSPRALEILQEVNWLSNNN